jgi:hypothetical protein
MYMCVSVAKSNGAPLAPITAAAWQMADVIHARFGATAGRNTSGCAEYEAQEPGDKGESDIKRPPDSDIPEFDRDHPEAPTGPGAPPFTGEDVEDVGHPRKRDTPPVM